MKNQLRHDDNFIDTTQYKKYTAVISQTGTSAPIVDKVNENTFTNPITFVRDGQGYYRVVCDDFIGDGTNVYCYIGTNDSINRTINWTSNYGGVFQISVWWNSTHLDDNITLIPIEIRIYNT